MVTKSELAKRKLRKKGSQLEYQEKLKVISYQLTIIKSSLRSAIYFRELDRLKTKSEFWKSTKFAHLQQFVTGWCMCYGQQKTESTHWKYTSSKHSEFKKTLYRELNVGARVFREYVGSMLMARNKLLSHVDIGVKSLAIPDFDTAISAHVFFYNYLKNEILKLPDMVQIDVLSIELWLENLQQEAESVIGTACNSTKGVTEYI